MDDNGKHAPSYQLDQEILDARGIKMTVEEVAGLPTCKYSERVHSLKLAEDDLAFLKGLRRRIKNRLASQNSRRRSVEHLRRLTRELRAVRACRHDALSERRTLQARRDAVRDKCDKLRRHVHMMLQQRSDTTEIPSIDIESKDTTTTIKIEKQQQIDTEPEDCIHKLYTDITAKDTKRRIKKEFTEEEIFKKEFQEEERIKEEKIEGNIFECKIGKLVQQSVNHIYNDKKKVFAKTVFIANDKLSSDIKSVVFTEQVKEDNCEVLNLSVKEGRRKSHGRKQLAPRRIAYYNDCDGHHALPKWLKQIKHGSAFYYCLIKGTAFLHQK